MSLKMRRNRHLPTKAARRSAGFVARSKGLLLWTGLVLSLAPFGFNCHSRTDLTPTSIYHDQQDSEDQTVRAMASLDSIEKDGAPAGEAKVRIGSDALLSASEAKVSGLMGKLSSAEDSLVKKGTSLVAVYDNACRGKQDAVLQIEAEAKVLQDDTSLAALNAELEADKCLLRVDENQIMHLIQPLPDEITSSFASQSEDQVQALATVNDPRATEARHITFSKALAAWDWFFSDAAINSTQLANDVIVAVIDTGILHTHPDLVENRYLSATNSNGFDFVNNDNDPTDDNGHGTHVAGIVGARANNGVGVTGVMGTRVKLMGIKVLAANGSGDIPAIVNGIRYAADNGAHVINMSLGGRGATTALRDAMNYAASRGVVVVVAAGNDNALMDAGNNFYSPSGYSRDVPGAISVGSVDAVSGARSSFSNYGTNYVWIGAPGSNGILSTYTGNGYNAIQGTSMASPVVAGAAALLVGAYRARGIAYTPADVVNLLTDSARPVTALNNFFRNGATLDIERAARLFFSRHVLAGTAATEAF